MNSSNHNGSRCSKSEWLPSNIVVMLSAKTGFHGIFMKESYPPVCTEESPNEKTINSYASHYDACERSDGRYHQFRQPHSGRAASRLDRHENGHRQRQVDH